MRRGQHHAWRRLGSVTPITSVMGTYAISDWVDMRQFPMAWPQNGDADERKIVADERLDKPSAASGG